MQRIGFIGIGLMGSRMAHHLLEAGYPLTVWNRTKSKADQLVSSGAKWEESPRLVAEASDIVITIVTDSQASEDVICGSNGILEGAHNGLILIDMGSIAPAMSRSIAKRAEEKGVSMLDAPVTGAPKVAEAAKLGIMIGGPQNIYEICLPVFEILAAKIVYVGEENGLGTTLKLINNLVLGVALQGAAEALVLSSKVGIDPQKVIDITSVGGARTGAMETRGPRMISRNFAPGFSTDNMYKDLSSAIDLAEEYGVTLPATTTSWDLLRSAKTRGLGSMDSCSVMTILEELAQTEVRGGDNS